MFSLLGEGDLIGCACAAAGKNEETLLPVALSAGDDIGPFLDEFNWGSGLCHGADDPFSDMADMTGECDFDGIRGVSSLPSA